MTMENFELDIDADGIALITFDVPGKSTNTISAAVTRELAEIADKLKTDAAIKGAVITSGKASGFCAGADLNEMNLSDGAATTDAARKAQFDLLYSLNKTLRAIETCGKPVAAALNGLALGGGLEIALACHYRVAADNPKIKLGLPEGKVGLIPGGGGTQRLPRLLGVMAAAPLLLESKESSPQEAKALGFIDAVVPADQLIDAAKTWVKTGDPVARWDKKDFKIPGGGPYHPNGMQMFLMGNAMVRKNTYGNYPAQMNMLKAVYEGLQAPMDAALRIESRYFVNTLNTPQARAMIRTLFVSMQALNKGASRPAGFAPSDAKKVAVLGAGMMGAGIAYVQAMVGIETILIDTTQEAAEKGKAHVADLLKKRVSKGRMTQEKADATLALVTPTTDYDLIKGSDLVVEAVFENRDVKAEVTRKAEAQLAETAVFGSNTSTLPITGLAEVSVRPKNFIGIHFFSPVDRMGLVEIIMAQETSQETLAKAVDYVLKIKKTPIVVNDSRGFYTSRCFSTYLAEGMEMLSEGWSPITIDNVGRGTGMPRGPLEMADDVALDLAYKIGEQTKKDLGDAYQPRPLDEILRQLVVEHGRLGRKNGKGFYDYPEKGAKRLWAGLADVIKPTILEAEPDAVQELRTRLLYRQAVEMARCFEEGVITDPRDADVGSILGWGYAPWTGGPASLIDSVGVAAFVATCERLAAQYGARFAPPQLLKDLAVKGETLYGRFTATVKAAA
jgi:3-hydroxyacyl-CoA dehydrogenase/enoyl-CoA hydratase/3-hydroxybutyryl-CoA epimerase